MYYACMYNIPHSRMFLCLIHVYTYTCTHADCDEDFTLSRMVTLQPNESSATVNITILDDWYPEDNETFTITGYSNNGALALSNILMFTITILDNDCEFHQECNTVKQHFYVLDKFM